MSLVVGVAGVVAVATATSAGSQVHGIDNVVVIVVDDMAANEMLALPKIRSLLGGTGVTYTNSFVNTSNCCPSRATFITGQRSPNHGVTSTDWRNDSDNSYLALDHDNTLPVWLSEAGYETIHVGKYLNGYGNLGLDPTVTDQAEVPPGWTDFHALVGEKRFTNFSLSENGVVNDYTGDENHQTDVLARISAQAVTDAVDADAPFFMWVTPFAPHTQSGNPPVPAVRHQHSFDGVELPRPENFNEVDVSDKPGFVRNQERLLQPDIRRLRELYEGRLESLLAVDDLVETVVQRLDDEGVLESTLIVFSSDNGFMMGNHRLEGKIRLYEESIRVPLLMSGGPFTGGVDRDMLVSNLDLAPTFLDLLGVQPRLPMDGVSLTDSIDDPDSYDNRALIIESAEGPGYAAVRTPDWMYAEYVGSGVELYDMVGDSQQLESLARSSQHANRRAALAGVLDRLRRCSGPACSLDAEGNPLGSAPPTTMTRPSSTPSTVSSTTMLPGTTPITTPRHTTPAGTITSTIPVTPSTPPVVSPSPTSAPPIVVISPVPSNDPLSRVDGGVSSRELATARRIEAAPSG